MPQLVVVRGGFFSLAMRDDATEILSRLVVSRPESRVSSKRAYIPLVTWASK